MASPEHCQEKVLSTVRCHPTPPHFTIIIFKYISHYNCFLIPSLAKHPECTMAMLCMQWAPFWFLVSHTHTHNAALEDSKRHYRLWTAFWSLALTIQPPGQESGTGPLYPVPFPSTTNKDFSWGLRKNTVFTCPSYHQHREGSVYSSVRNSGLCVAETIFSLIILLILSSSLRYLPPWTSHLTPWHCEPSWMQLLYAPLGQNPPLWCICCCWAKTAWLLSPSSQHSENGLPQRSQWHLVLKENFLTSAKSPLLEQVLRESRVCRPPHWLNTYIGFEGMKYRAHANKPTQLDMLPAHQKCLLSDCREHCAIWGMQYTCVKLSVPPTPPYDYWSTKGYTSMVPTL